MVDRLTLPCCLSIAILAGCVTPPGDTEPPHFEDGADEIGIDGGAESGFVDETGVEETGVERYKEDGYCLLDAEDGTKAWRHHCGGDLDFTVEGSYFQFGEGWVPTEFGMYVGFGPTYADEWLEDDDVYETPFVAACCGGPMDFENTDEEYKNAYQLNCLLDAVQQLCAALPKYYKALGDNAALPTQKQRYYDIAEGLNSSEKQTECVYALYEGEDPEFYLAGTSWSLIDNEDAHYTLTINLLEILEIDYPEDPADLAECTSINDNDDNVLPLVEAIAGDANNFTIAVGDGVLTNNGGVTQALDPDPASVLSVAFDPASGTLELRDFVLKGNSAAIVVESFPVAVDRWSLRLVAPVVARPVRGIYTYPAGSMTFVANGVYMGEVISIVGNNAGTVTVAEDSSGWEVAGLEVEYHDGNSLWAFATGVLEFQ